MATKKEAKKARRAKASSYIRKGYKVQVIAGNERGKQGTVLRVMADHGRVVVEGVNVRKKHQRASQQNPDGGIVSMELAVDISNVMLLDPTSGQPSRVRIRVESDGTKERIAVKSGNPIPRP